MKTPSPTVTADLSDPDHIECPYRLYEKLHAAGGVGRDPAVGALVAGHAALVDFSKDTATFSSSITEDGHGPRHMGVSPEPVQDDVEEILSHAHPIVNALFTADPPEHTRHRKLLSKALSPRRVRELAPHIRQIADDLVDSFERDGSVELVEQFAVPLPVTVIADILGVDRADLWTFKRWGDLMISGNIDVLDHAQRREVARAVVELHEYFVPRIEARRRQPADDLLSEMVNVEADGEAPLTTGELLPIIDQVLLAGHETTTNPIGNAMLVLLRDPALMKRVREDRSLIRPMLEETLRWDPPIQCTYRRATRDASVGGMAVAEGELVLPLWAAAGWDPDEFPQPETFDIDRPNLHRHMGFGHGPHFCAGAELARLEAAIAFDVLLDRFEAIGLDEAASDLSYLPSFASRGRKRIVLTIRGAAGSTKAVRRS